MAAGLLVWDSSGNLVVDITSRLSRFVGAYVFPSPAANGSVTDAGLLQGTPWFSFAPTAIWGYINMDVSRPVFSISGDTISWSYSAPFSSENMKITGTLYYGVY